MFKKGRKVRVRKDLHEGVAGDDVVVEPMLEYAGKYAIITESGNVTHLNIDNGEFNWTPEMLVLLFKKGDIIKIRGDLSEGRCGDNYVVEKMLKYRGRITTVAYMISENALKLQVDNRNWNWTPEMLEVFDSNEKTRLRKAIKGSKRKWETLEKDYEDGLKSVDFLYKDMTASCGFCHNYRDLTLIKPCSECPVRKECNEINAMVIDRRPINKIISSAFKAINKYTKIADLNPIKQDFVRGDYVKGLPSASNKYSITTEDMLVGRVIEAPENTPNYMKIQVLVHKTNSYHEEKRSVHTVENSQKLFEKLAFE